MRVVFYSDYIGSDVNSAPLSASENLKINEIVNNAIQAKYPYIHCVIIQDPADGPKMHFYNIYQMRAVKDEARAMAARLYLEYIDNAAMRERTGQQSHALSAGKPGRSPEGMEVP